MVRGKPLQTRVTSLRLVFLGLKRKVFQGNVLFVANLAMELLIVGKKTIEVAAASKEEKQRINPSASQ